MAGKLIRLADGTLIEVDVAADHVEQISGGITKKVNSSLNSIEPILLRACEPIIAAWRKFDHPVEIQGMEIELSLSFEAEGNIYVTKARSGANITVRLTMKPRA